MRNIIILLFYIICLLTIISCNTIGNEMNILYINKLDYFLKLKNQKQIKIEHSSKPDERISKIKVYDNENVLYFYTDFLSDSKNILNYIYLYNFKNNERRMIAKIPTGTEYIINDFILIENAVYYCLDLFNNQIDKNDLIRNTLYEYDIFSKINKKIKVFSDRNWLQQLKRYKKNIICNFENDIKKSFVLFDPNKYIIINKGDGEIKDINSKGEGLLIINDKILLLKDVFVLTNPIKIVNVPNTVNCYWINYNEFVIQTEIKKDNPVANFLFSPSIDSKQYKSLNYKYEIYNLSRNELKSINFSMQTNNHVMIVDIF